MSDQFIDLILGSLEKTDTSAVWSESDALSTVYRGKIEYVADAVKALFINAYRDGIHMAIEGQFSKGCPGDSDGERRGSAKQGTGERYSFPGTLQPFPVSDGNGRLH